jgi:hypothetical protein
MKLSILNMREREREREREWEWEWEMVREREGDLIRSIRPPRNRSLVSGVAEVFLYMWIGFVRIDFSKAFH